MLPGPGQSRAVGGDHTHLLAIRARLSTRGAARKAGGVVHDAI